ncbi:MAG: DUF6732 family protein [Marivita sp.]|uniref:DUF6732 family protein n=1 Tax=Marivita sp. TaxID=2003365 RepID=UPI003EF81280
MIRMFLITVLTLSAGPALAHAGHLGGLAGHDHWVAGAAVGIAIGIAAWTAVRGRKRRAKSREETPDAEEQPA